MAALLQWRKFNFFDVRGNADGGKLAEATKESRVTCTSSGRGVVYVGDNNGWVHCLTRQLHLSSFLAHDNAISCIAAFDHTTVIITVANGEEGPSEVKIWAPDKINSQGLPPCLRKILPNPKVSHSSSRDPARGQIALVTCLAVHPNMSLMALGFSDGTIMLYRGEIIRERGSKHQILLSLSSCVTSLHLKHTARITYLFVTTLTNVYCINCTTKEKETTVELDSAGSKQYCSTLADGRHEHQFLVARPDAIYSYTIDSRGSCFIFEGEKLRVAWFRGYLLVASMDRGVLAGNRNDCVVTIYDLTNKLVALSTRVRGLAGIVSEWGGLYLITTDPPALIHLPEKDLQSKFELLFKKNQFDIAISLAKTQGCDPEEVAEILRQYGDWLYSKGSHAAAMEQYIKTIPHVEPSYVIRKYLDTQHIQTLTTYLQALHKSDSATADHTSLLLNCYTRLRDTKQLDEFIMSKNGAIDLDVELGVRVCRSAGYFDHALALSAKHKLHHHHLAILIEEKEDYASSLRYISTLEFDEAKENILRYGSVLLNHIPDETTELIIQLCLDYKPSNQPIIHEGPLDRYLQPEDSVCGNPEDFEYLLVGYSEQAIAFLEKIQGKLTPQLYTTLLSEYLHQYSLAPEGQAQATLGEKVMNLLQNTESGFSRDHALLLCDKHQFHAGMLLLWEQAGMYDQLLSYHAEQGDMKSVIGLCQRRSHQQPRLWCSALKLITSATSPPTSEHLRLVLGHIEQQVLLHPLEVVDMLAASPHITLGLVREYLQGVVSSYSETLSEESSRTEQYQAQTSAMRETISNIRTSATQFTGTKCNVCNHELELPSVHFLCRHSFHQHCFESYSENDADCPVCLPENRKMLDIFKDQENHRNQHDQFHEQLERSTDSFSVVADYLGRGVFTHLHSLASIYPPLNTTKKTSQKKPQSISQSMGPSSADVADSVKSVPGNFMQASQFTVSNNTEAKVRVLEHSKQKQKAFVPGTEARIRSSEKYNTGSLGIDEEGRLRLTEGQNHSILEKKSEGRLPLESNKPGNINLGGPSSEARLRHEQKSKILTSPSEGRLRADMSSNITIPKPESRSKVEAADKIVSSFRENKTKFPSTDPGQYSSSLQDFITPSSLSIIAQTEQIESISSALSTTHLSGKVKKSFVDNPFEGDTVEDETVRDGFETEAVSENSFEDDYDKTKNPFAEETVNVDYKYDDDPNNPFKDDKHSMSDDYDSTLNPFGPS